ncbi:vesicle transport through interaction with t-SNAREs homolog 1B-like [Amphiura filiformis]|uniref:vesicle transport through interaction with t-SNAREs homolog 1B-like n=1 Tax=Amphiura filiformis TaxID=82378 RepID=UPI003B216818
MSSEQFERYEEDYRTIYDDLKFKVEVKIPTCGGEEKKQIVREVERGIEEASQVLQEMEAQAKPAPGSYRTQMIARIRNHRRDLDKLFRDLKRTGSGSRDELFGGGFYTSNAVDNQINAMQNAQRSRLLQGTDSLNRASDSIDRTHRIAAETDEIGVGIIDELDSQKEQLLSARDKLEDMDSNIGKSRRILKSMGRRVVTDKMILTAVILIELGILGGVIYWKFFSK